MAPARLQFDMTLRPAGARATPRDTETPLRLLLLADLGGDRSVPLAARRPLKIDIDEFDRVLARIAPRLVLELDDLPSHVYTADGDRRCLASRYSVPLMRSCSSRSASACRSSATRWRRLRAAASSAQASASACSAAMRCAVRSACHQARRCCANG